MTTDERIEKVESQLARMRWCNRCLIGCIVLSVGVWFIMKTLAPETAWAQSGAKAIQATRFIVEDENGKPRAELSMGKQGPQLAMWNENGKPRIYLGVNDLGKWLSLWDENGTHRGSLAVRQDGPAVTLNDENGKPRARVRVLKDGPQFLLTDENDKTIWSAP